MWPIVFWGVFVIAITIRRAMYLSSRRRSTRMRSCRTSRSASSPATWGVRQALLGAQAPLARIVKSGPDEGQPPRLRGPGGDGRAALRELPKIEHRTAYLSLLSNLAMLSGAPRHHHGPHLRVRRGGRARGRPDDRPSLQGGAPLAGGISGAMNCTAFGLIVAILGLIAGARSSTARRGRWWTTSRATVQITPAS